MKSKTFLLGIMICFLAGCSGGGSTPGDDLFIPDISNQWVSSRTSIFFFNADKTNVNESTFTGEEEGTRTVDGQEISYNDDFNGHFKNYDISFTFTEGPDSLVTYSGKFVKGSNPLKMQLKGTNGKTLTITRQPN
jgi:hypothetical protein